MSFFETQERNLFLASYLNANLESFVYNKKKIDFIIIHHEIGQALSSLVEINESLITPDFLDFIESMSQDKGYKKINFRITPSLKSINSNVLKLLLLRGYNTQLTFTSLLLLDIDLAVIWSNLRKSFKSLINKEIKNTTTKFYDWSSSEDFLFVDWISLYGDAVKRGSKELSKESISIMQNTIKNDKGFITLCYEDNQLLGAILFNYHTGIAYYSAAANTPLVESSKERNIGHLLMWQGIKKLKEIGCHTLEIGPLDFENQPCSISNPKLLNITNFKLGFGGDIVAVFNFTKML